MLFFSASIMLTTLPVDLTEGRFDAATGFGRLFCLARIIALMRFCTGSVTIEGFHSSVRSFTSLLMSASTF